MEVILKEIEVSFDIDDIVVDLTRGPDNSVLDHVLSVDDAYDDSVLEETTADVEVKTDDDVCELVLIVLFSVGEADKAPELILDDEDVLETTGDTVIVPGDKVGVTGFSFGSKQVSINEAEVCPTLFAK